VRKKALGSRKLTGLVAFLLQAGRKAKSAKALQKEMVVFINPIYSSRYFYKDLLVHRMKYPFYHLKAFPIHG